MSFTKSRFYYMNPYEIHKAIINEYVLQRPGDTKLLRRDSSGDKTDLDVIKENHKFLWDDSEPVTWEQQFAKKYYDKLFKEYCIGDLSRFKENKVALRWRVQQEVVIGKGQFTCGNKKCSEKADLRTWEVNFGYLESGEKKNALVKIRLCPDCSKKLNYHSKKREIKRVKHKNKKKNTSSSKKEAPVDELETQKYQPTSSNAANDGGSEEETSNNSPKMSHWSNIKAPETKSRDEEMEEYLQDLLL